MNYSEHSPDIPLKDRLVLNHERDRVFASMIDLRTGREAGREILNGAFSPGKRRIVIMGPPGSGKTLALIQFRTAFLENAKLLTGRTPEIISHQYDSFLTGGPDDDTEEFNQGMIDKVIEDEERHPNAFDEIEIPAVGSTDVRNIGVSFIKRLAQISKAEGDNTLFVFMVRNYAIQKRAAFIRQEIKEMGEKLTDNQERNRRIIDYLQAHGIFIQNLPQGRIGPYPDIFSHFGKMARLQQMNRINEEEDLLASDWIGKNFAEYQKNRGRLFLPPISAGEVDDVYEEFGVSFSSIDKSIISDNARENRSSDFAQVTTENVKNIALDQAAYAIHRFTEMDVPEENFYLIFNSLSKKPLYLDYSIYSNTFDE